MGKHGPAWNFIHDPYAKIGEEVIETYSVHCYAFKVMDIQEEKIAGYIVQNWGAQRKWEHKKVFYPHGQYKIKIRKNHGRPFGSL